MKGYLPFVFTSHLVIKEIPNFTQCAFQVEIPQSKKIAWDRGEELTQGTWSSFESIVLEEVHLKCKDGCEDDQVI